MKPWIPRGGRVAVLLLSVLVASLIFLPHPHKHAAGQEQLPGIPPNPGANLAAESENKAIANSMPELGNLPVPQPAPAEFPGKQLWQENSESASQRRPVTEARELLRHLQKQSAEVLALRLRTSWLDDPPKKAGGMEKRTERMVIETALAQALQKGDSVAAGRACEQLSSWLREPALPMMVKGDIVRVLGAAQTEQSVNVLLKDYQRISDNALRQMLRVEIGKTGDVRWDARFHEELSEPLEREWAKINGDVQLAQAVADGMAKVGRSEAVSLLLGEVFRSSGSVDGLSHLVDPRAQVSLVALEKVRNPNAIAVLASGLLGKDSSEVQEYVCGATLSSMGTSRATAVLLQWSMLASDQDAKRADQWFGRMRDAASYKLAGDVLERGGEFRFQSEKVRDVVSFHWQKR